MDVHALTLEVRALARLNLEELRTEWRRRYGPPPRLRSPELLAHLLAWRIQADAFGGLDAETRPQVYWNYKQRAQDRMALVVRTGGDPANWAAPVIAQIRALDPDQPVYNVFTMEDIVDRSLSQRRLNAVLVAVFAGVSLLLAAIGIYGVVAYSVQQRVREFGIRLALGANRRDVMRIVVLRAAAIACIGSVLGLGAAAALGRFLQTMLFEVSATDAVSYASAAAVLIAVAVIASYVPVRRALAMDPMQSLRAD